MPTTHAALTFSRVGIFILSFTLGMAIAHAESPDLKARLERLDAGQKEALIRLLGGRTRDLPHEDDQVLGILANLQSAIRRVPVTIQSPVRVVMRFPSFSMSHSPRRVGAVTGTGICFRGCRWSPHGHLMVTSWSPHGHLMVTSWSPHGHLMGAIPCPAWKRRPQEHLSVPNRI